jgi:hypothetical protein
MILDLNYSPLSALNEANLISATPDFKFQFHNAIFGLKIWGNTDVQKGEVCLATLIASEKNCITPMLKGNFAIFYMLAKYVPGDIKYIFTKFYRHISTNNEANRKFVILISNFSTRL